MRPLCKLLHEQLLKSGQGPLVRYCAHQETMNGTSEQKYLPFGSRWGWPGRGYRYSNLRAFVSLGLPISTDKNLNITLLP